MLPALAAHPRLKGFEFDSWAGIQVPRHAPDEVAQRLSTVLYSATQNTATRQAIARSIHLQPQHRAESCAVAAGRHRPPPRRPMP